MRLPISTLTLCKLMQLVGVFFILAGVVQDVAAHQAHRSESLAEWYLFGAMLYTAGRLVAWMSSRQP